MKVRHRLLWIAAGIAAAVTIAFGQGISIEGPQGHSTSRPAGETAAGEDTVSYWAYKNTKQPESPSSAHSSLSVRYGSNIRYGSGFHIRRGIDNRRGPFRYRIRDYSRRRFADLRPNSQGARFAIPRSSYDSRIDYTTSFKGRKRFGSSIRYGFR